MRIRVEFDLMEEFMYVNKILKFHQYREWDITVILENVYKSYEILERNWYKTQTVKYGSNKLYKG